MDENATKEQIQHVVDEMRKYGRDSRVVSGKDLNVVCVIGDEKGFPFDHFYTLPGVQDVKPVEKPYKIISRKHDNRKRPVVIDGVEIGNGMPVYFAGPCAIEDKDQLFRIAGEVKSAGAHVLRGDAYKHRTGPHSFQGLFEEGLQYLGEASREFGMPAVSEIMDSNHIEFFEKYGISIYKIGARNAQNFALIREVARVGKPVLIKNGIGCDAETFLSAAEYIASEGNRDIILCYRGTVPMGKDESFSRNAVNIALLPAIKEESYLPLILDPSHGAGNRISVPGVSYAAIAAGADGVMIDVHYNPEQAPVDGKQAVLPDEFRDIVQNCTRIYEALRKSQTYAK